MRKENFILKANLIHLNNYDYSLVDYVNNSTKVKILCPIHGLFEQAPNNHLKNQGCPKCGVISRTKTRSKPIKTFIHEANLTPSNKFDYSLVNYSNNKLDVKIICPIHGIFEQTPHHHITLKYGCKECSNRQSTNTEFIKKAKMGMQLAQSVYIK